MEKIKYVYGPVPSRRLGISLGISPITKKTCNYSCIYCQLGRTNHLTNKREEFFPLKNIISEFEQVLRSNLEFDVVTIVGEGEPTLYLSLGRLISNIKKRTDKPVVVITNGALLYDQEVQDELCMADIVMPSIDAFDEKSYKAINRPYGHLDYHTVYNGLRMFSKKYKGQLWLEVMLVENFNDSNEELMKLRDLLKIIRYDRLYLNTPIRPPAESYAKVISNIKMKEAADILGGFPIDLLVSEGFHSDIENHYSAILSIIRRHPMNQFEIDWFLKSRGCSDQGDIILELQNDDKIEKIKYLNIFTYRLF